MGTITVRLGVAIVVLASLNFTSTAWSDVVEIAPTNPVNFGQFGISVSGIPDVNGDGAGDFIVGASSENGGAQQSGRVYVYSGKTGALLRTHVSPNPEFQGEFGISVAGIGDINNDGRGDYIVGAWQENGNGVNDSGRVYVYSGATGGLIRTHTMPGAETFGRFGYAVAAIDDLTGDGRPDYIAGAEGGGSGGKVFIFSGGSGALVREHSSPNRRSGGGFGVAVAGIPDVNNDARGDYIVGAPYESPGGSPGNAGRAYIYSGSNGTLLHTLKSPNEQSSGQFGFSVAGGGDIGGNGLGDVIVGAWLEDVGGVQLAGRAYAFSGTTGALIQTFVSPNPESSGVFGNSVATLHDRTGDGVADFLIGAPGDGGGASSSPGRAYVMNGANATLIDTLQSPYASSGNREFGYSVSALPDANSDGREDFIIGADEDEGANGLPNEGRAYLIRDLVNDGCSLFVDELALTNGFTFVTTIGATGAASGSACLDKMEKDVWFTYTATCTGTLTVDMCLGANFDTVLALYQGCGFGPPLFACNLSTVLACNDDSCDLRSKITAPVTIGQCYRVRLGGFQGDSGTGVIHVDCAPSCAGDLNADGQVNGADLATLLGAWGSAAPGPDIDGNGNVDAADLSILLGNWGPC